MAVSFGESFALVWLQIPTIGLIELDLMDLEEGRRSARPTTGTHRGCRQPSQVISI
jgi:hypothetical protein